MKTTILLPRSEIFLQSINFVNYLNQKTKNVEMKEKIKKLLIITQTFLIDDVCNVSKSKEKNNLCLKNNYLHH